MKAHWYTHIQIHTCVYTYTEMLTRVTDYIIAYHAQNAEITMLNQTQCTHNPSILSLATASRAGK